jgi:hypothetical protein
MDTATALDLVMPYGYGKGGGTRQQQLNTIGVHLSLVTHTYCVSSSKHTL